MDLKRIPDPRLDQCRADMAASPMADPAVEYPEWYLKRWHFLPEGYLSRRGIAAYETFIRALYNYGQEHRVMRALARRVAADAPSRVLDLGCGPGFALAAMHRALAAAELTGTDLSPFMLEAARDRLHGGARLVHADAHHLPFEPPQFDAITAVHFFGHMPVPLAAEAFAEARRIAGAKTRLYVIDHRWHRARPSVADWRPVSRQSLLGGMARLSVFVASGRESAQTA